MSKKVNRAVLRRRTVAAVLLAAVPVLVFLAYHSVTTDQYRLYSRSYQYYVSEAAACRAMEDSDLGAHYAYLADEWDESARMAGAYLWQHRAGAASLSIVGAACLAGGVRLLLADRREKENEAKKGETKA